MTCRRTGVRRRCRGQDRASRDRGPRRARGARCARPTSTWSPAAAWTEALDGVPRGLPPRAERAPRRGRDRPPGGGRRRPGRGRAAGLPLGAAPARLGDAAPPAQGGRGGGCARRRSGLDRAAARRLPPEPARPPRWPGGSKCPTRSTRRSPTSTSADVAEVAALVLTEPGHERATYELAGPELTTVRGLAAVASDVLGRAVVAVESRPAPAGRPARGRRSRPRPARTCWPCSPRTTSGAWPGTRASSRAPRPAAHPRGATSSCGRGER